MNEVMGGRPMTVFGDGLQTRAFSYVGDVAPIIARAPTVTAAYQQVFNVGADQPYTVLELAQQVAAAFGVEPRVEHLPARREVVHAFSSHEKVHRIFSPPEPISLKDGLGRMAQWARTLGSRPPVEFGSEIEVPVNLPPSWVKKNG
jgi:UDP-glucose 4-epimerase